jgi:DNA-binding winged helix-turn-helix (wHTH) protein/TolB-like protein
LETSGANKNGRSEDRYRFAFSDFEIDPANRLLLKDGETVPLSGKAFDVLLVLAENPGRLLEKEELLEKVWPGDFVEEGNLARNVSTLRKALGDNGKEHKYIATVQGHGYRFLPDVSKIGPGQPDIEKEGKALLQIENVPITSESSHASRRWILAIVAGAVLLTAGWLGTERFFTSPNQIKSLAVLPLRSLNADDNYLGVGIADAVIRRVSQSRQVTVRPTSAVLRYAKEDGDTLAAAKELNTDAVLEGTVQRSGGQLRISINLLRTTDGASLWADNFDMLESDIFAIQDRVAEQVASRLRLRLDSSQQAGSYNKYPANPVAYELYMKGLFSLGDRGFEDSMPQMAATIDFLKKSIEADPNYAPARAQLAFAYAWTATQIEPTVPKWADLAREEIARAQELDPNLAETHLANSILLSSAYGDYQIEAAAREALTARQLNPNASHGELAAMYGHLGLDDLASAELQRELEIDPTSQSLKELTLLLPFWRADADSFYEAREKVSPATQYAAPWYYMRKGRLDDAQHSLDERLPRNSRDFQLLMQAALLHALQGQAEDAQKRVQQIIAMNLPPERSHHTTYYAACIYALGGKSIEAVKWLRETANTGFPNYPLFARDAYLDRIRQSPDFIQFMAEQKARFERNRQEFVG